MGRNGPNFLRLVSLGLLLGAAVLFFFQLIAYSRERANLPEGLTIAGVPVPSRPLTATATTSVGSANPTPTVPIQKLQRCSPRTSRRTDSRAGSVAVDIPHT